MLRGGDQRAEEQKMLRVVIREALRPALQLVSQLQESLFPIDNESGFVSSFAYGETRKNTPFVRPCTDGTLDKGDGMCAFPCIRQFTKALRVRIRLRPENKALRHTRIRMESESSS